MDTDKEGYVVVGLLLSSENELAGGLGAYTLGLVAPEDIIVLDALGGEPLKHVSYC